MKLNSSTAETFQLWGEDNLTLSRAARVSISLHVDHQRYTPHKHTHPPPPHSHTHPTPHPQSPTHTTHAHAHTHMHTHTHTHTHTHSTLSPVLFELCRSSSVILRATQPDWPWTE